MDILSVLLAFFPVLAIFFLLLVYRVAADTAGYIGWGVAALVAWLYFQTPVEVVLTASAAGLVASLPIALVMAASIMQITLMQETGAVARVVALMKTIAPGQQVVQIMIINVGFGILLTSLGAVTVSILPPIMIALGYSTVAAILLPAIGYDALCTYALLGIPAVVFAQFVGQPVQEVGLHFAYFMPVISTCIALGMLQLTGGAKMVREGLFPALLAGVTAGGVAILMAHAGLVTITGIAAGLAVILVLVAYVKLTGKTLQDRGMLSEKDLAAEARISLPRAVSPWIILTVLSLILNAPFLPFFKMTFVDWAMPLEIIPGNPEKIRLFWQAYFWVAICTFLALPIMRATGEQVRRGLKTAAKRAGRPIMSASVFFAIAYVMNHSGKGADWTLANPMHNMIHVMASASANAFGQFYAAVAPFLGLLGGFISGSETSSIAMLTKLHLSTAEHIGASGVVIAAGSAIGGGLASVISPAKLQNAASSIDRIREASAAIRPAFVVSMLITGVCAVMTMLWAY
ncbi:lactate permease [Humidesulfovibrio mexicanus]|uniref:L-lactate permease n=1 Tax=Humidesulfovibrio mexicanus TaxID=147047 RepID=A0A238YUK5_9BACT|nr:L-lactate permease [Humidesulfovibrio mexicanus]SNR74632.1 lactate permease [Humidesulfovibrio mexicanus]